MNRIFTFGLRLLSTILFVLMALMVWPQTVLAEGPDKSGVKPQVLNLPSGPGSIQGLGESFEPQLNTGTASYNIPLVVPPGAGGHAPDLSLSYDGGQGNGPFGLGWRLKMPYIQRQTDKGLPHYVDEDLFVHSSGEELVPLADGSYRYEVESSFTRFRRLGEGWEATERNGKRWLLGETAKGRQLNPLGIFCWMPQRYIDTNGNEIRFFYTHHEGQIYLSEIRYNVDRAIPYGKEPPDAGVRFTIEYNERSDPLLDYRSRARVRTAWLASAIEITALGQRVRRYELAYENRHGGSRLTDVHFLGRELISWQDDPTEGLPPLRFDYSEFDPQRATNVSMVQPPPLNVSHPDVDLVDINGDALPDLLYTDRNDLHRFYINRGKGRWAADPLYPQQSPNALLGTDGVQLADVDGNGLSDLLIKSGRGVNAPFFYYPNQGGNAWELDDKVSFDQNPDFTYEDSDVWLVDLDQDKRIDVLRATDTRYYIYFNGVKGWSAGAEIVDPLSFGRPLVARDPRVKLADMNGDRMQDVVFIRDNQVVYFPSKGFGEFDEEHVVIMENSPNYARPEEALLADINGDGLTDLLQVNRFSISFWLNQAGAGYASKVDLTDVPEYIRGQTTLRLADMNGDGTTDLLYSNYPSAPEEIFRYVSFNGNRLPNLLTSIDNGLGRVIGLSYRTSTDYYVDEWNAGQQWTQRSPVPVPVVSRSTVKDKLSQQIYVTDYAYRNAYYDGEEKTFRGFALAQQSDLGDQSAPTQLQQLIFDTGMTDESRKGLILQQDIVAAGGTCGADQVPVAAMLRTEPAASWRGANRADKNQNKATSETRFLRKNRFFDYHSAQIRPTTQPPSSSVTLPQRLQASKPVNCYSRTLNQIRTDLLANATDHRKSTFSYVRQSDLFEYETTTTPRRKQQTFLYDEYGNRTQEFNYGEVTINGTNRALGNDERLTSSSYIINTEKWIVDRLSEVRDRDLNSNFVSHQRNYYDGPGFMGLALGKLSKGNLTRQESNLGPHADNRWVQSKRYRYDQYGNQTGIMDANGQHTNGTPNDNGHWSEITFDPTFHAYPIVEAIHLEDGQTLEMSAEYDLGFGVITKTSDFNGNESYFLYDSLARVSAIIEPGDTHLYPTQRFTYTIGSEISSITTDSREQFGTPDTYRSVSYLDGLGRPLQTRREAENGQVIVEEAVTFNARQGEKEKFQPYFDNSFAYAPPNASWSVMRAALPRTTTHYDPTGRPVRVENPDGSFGSIIYRPLAQIQYDEEDNTADSAHFGTPKTVFYDGLERITAVRELNHVDGQLETYSTTYEYDPLGNLTRIVDAQNNNTISQYDALSRRLYMNNPDQGEMFYQYDEVGNLLQTTDAKGQTIRYTYDAANRPLSEQWQIGNGRLMPYVAYHYDDEHSPTHPDAQNTLGQLTYIEDEAGETYFSYDARGNVTGNIRHLAEENIDFVTRMTYDAQDRLTEVTYPNGKSVSYEYNEQKRLERIPGFIDNIDYTAFGQRDSTLYANGVTTSYQYDNRLRMRLLQSLVLTKEGTNASQLALQHLTYAFDNRSNIISISDNRPERTEQNDQTQTYSYDNLYRLSNATGTYGQIDYTYNRIGNMTYKSSTSADARLNLGEMRYGENGAGPHALTFADGDIYTYDGNGNRTEKADTTYTWDYRNQLTSVEDGNTTSSYQYDADGQRVRQTVMNNGVMTTTLYIGRYAEVRGDQLVQYIFADDGRIAQLTTPFDPDQLIQGFTDEEDKREPSSRQVTPETTWYLPDHLGGTSLMVDQNGQITSEVAYYPYGLTRYESNGGEVRYRFTGKELDATGLHYYGARYYDATTSAWLSTDPIFTSYMPRGDKERDQNLPIEDKEHDQNLPGMGGVFNPFNLALYSYSRLNPVVYYDPDGKEYIFAKFNKSDPKDISTLSVGDYQGVRDVNRDGKNDACVSFLQFISKKSNVYNTKTGKWGTVPTTSKWKEGMDVKTAIEKDKIKPGTLIATFLDGKYPNKSHGNHGAIFVEGIYKNGKLTGIKVFDSWSNKPGGGNERPLHFDKRNSGRSNDASAFSIVE